MNIDEQIMNLVHTAEQLKYLPESDPTKILWVKRTKLFIKMHYGEEYVDMFESALLGSPTGGVITPVWARDGYQKRLEGVIKLLLALKEEPLHMLPEHIHDVIEDTKNNISDSNQYKGISITGDGHTIVLGNGSTINNVDIKSVLEEVKRQISVSIPEGQEKNSALKALNDITTNGTFVSVTGQLLGELLKRMTSPH